VDLQPDPGARSPVNRGRLDADMGHLARLPEPTRRVLYPYVQAQPSAVSRDKAAAGVGVPRHVAKFHPDKLVVDSLLQAEYRRRSGRQGLGAGRLTRLYSRGSRELAVAQPDRRYHLAGQLIAHAISEAGSTGQPVAEALDGPARERGRWLGDEVRRRAGSRASHSTLLSAVRGVLDEEGYETRADPAGLTLANCPFRAVAQQYIAVVCGMNLAVITGLLDRVGHLSFSARPTPRKDDAACAWPRRAPSAPEVPPDIGTRLRREPA
jgi:predicted ArsR family transcriptional regulator